MATAAAATTTELSMKLHIDTRAQRVLFAEARKDVVDFLFSLLALPVATVFKLLGEESMVGCVGNLYASVEKLDATYVQPGTAKEALLCPTVLSPLVSTNGSLFSLPAPPSAPAFFRCGDSSNDTMHVLGGSYSNSSCRGYMTDAFGTVCPSCGRKMVTEMKLVSTAGSGQSDEVAAGGRNGFVQGVVMDDLTVMPMSAISSITLVKTFAVRDLGDLHEQTVQLGYKEGLGILKASLQSKTVLTDVFLGKKAAPGHA